MQNGICGCWKSNILNVIVNFITLMSTSSYKWSCEPSILIIHDRVQNRWKMIQKNNDKKFVADVWKIILSLTFNSMESYHPEHLLVYYKFLKNWNFWRTYSTSGIGLLQDPPFYCKTFCWIDNLVRRLLLLKIVLHSLFADALYMYGLQPNSAYADPYWLICVGSICIKKTLFPFWTG